MCRIVYLINWRNIRRGMSSYRANISGRFSRSLCVLPFDGRASGRCAIAVTYLWRSEGGWGGGWGDRAAATTHHQKYLPKECYRTHASYATSCFFFWCVDTTYPHFASCSTIVAVYAARLCCFFLSVRPLCFIFFFFFFGERWLSHTRTNCDKSE